jgi:hypothetical protein
MLASKFKARMITVAYGQICHYKKKYNNYNYKKKIISF